MKFKLTEAISLNMKDMWQEFYKMSESDIIKLFGKTASTVSSKEPCFITPTGKIIDVGKALGFDYTMHVDLIIKILEHIYNSLYDNGVPFNDLIYKNDIDIDKEGVIGLNWLFSNGWIAINLGSKYVDNRPYAVFPSREEDHPTTTQYDIVESALEKAQKNKKERFIAFLGTEIGEWDLKETFAEDIIKSIKRYYSSGRIYENKRKDIMRFKLVEDLLSEAIQLGTEEFEKLIKNSYPKISLEDASEYVQLDPTFNKGNNALGEYRRWILDLAQRSGGKIDNVGHLKDILTRFNDEKKNLVNKDIMKYKTMDELDAMLNDDSSYKDLSHRQEVRQRQKNRKSADLDKDAEKVYEDNEWEVWIPKTYAASCKLGQGTTWCTASTENDYYYNYYKGNYGGNYYINIKKSNPEEKYQFHFETGQFMDKDDYGIDIEEFLKNNEGLNEFYYKTIAEPLMQKISDYSEGDVAKVNVPATTIADGASQNSGREGLSEKFICDTLFGDIYDWFDTFYDFWGNVDMSYFLNYELDQRKWYPRLKKAYVANNGTEDSDKYEDLDEGKQIRYFINHDSDIKAAVGNAYNNACVTGAIDEATSDVEQGILNAMPDWVNKKQTHLSTGGVYSTIAINTEDFLQYIKKDWIKLFASDDVEIRSAGMSDLVGALIWQSLADKCSLYEPRYGWNGFSASTFDDMLYEALNTIVYGDDYTQELDANESLKSPLKFKLVEELQKSLNEVFDIDGELYHPDEYRNIKINDNFKEWFKDGGITNAYHDPLIVYHGSSYDFDYFIPNKSSIDFPDAVYFTDNKKIAETYGNTKPYFIRMQKPYYINARRKSFNDFYDEMALELNQAFDSGYDGVIIRDIKDDSIQNGSKLVGTTYVIFDSYNIKSVNNNGNWDNDTNNVYEASQINEVYPNKGESKKDFIARFMSATKDEYPDVKQRYAVSLQYWKNRNKKKD